MNKDDLFIDENLDIVHNNQMNERWQQEEDNRRLKEFVNEPDWDKLEKQNLSALQQFEKGLTKVDIKEMATQAIDTCLEKGNPLQVGEALAGMQLFIDEVKADKKFKDYIREEILKNPRGVVTKSGAKIEACEVGTSYNFENTGDVEWEMLDAALKTAKNNLKEREEFLKRVPAAGIDVLDPLTGEVIKIHAPSKSSTSSYKVTLSKGF